eukprot:SAG31_NODE_546_length_14230_cov_18.112660_16_plen_107_part_00
MVGLGLATSVGLLLGLGLLISVRVIYDVIYVAPHAGLCRAVERSTQSGAPSVLSVHAGDTSFCTQVTRVGWTSQRPTASGISVAGLGWNGLGATPVTQHGTGGPVN